MAARADNRNQLSISRYVSSDEIIKELFSGGPFMVSTTVSYIILL
jgi:hypothetical protein